MHKVAIIGAAGQIGTALISRLEHDKKLTPIGICRNKVSAELLRAFECEVRIGDVADPDQTHGLIGDCETVINCAFAPGLPRQSKNANDAIIRRVSAVLSGSDGKWFVHLSSVVVYGLLPNAKSTYERPIPDS